MVQTAKHTPGPWKIVKYGTGNIKTGEGFSRKLVGETIYICDLDADLSEANAALIAVAPKMLMVLQDVLKNSVRPHPAREYEGHYLYGHMLALEKAQELVDEIMGAP